MGALTKDDFNQLQKMIKQVVRDEVESEAESLQSSINSKIVMARLELSGNIRSLGGKIKDLTLKIDKNHKEVKKEISKVSDFLDREILNTNRRVKRLEQQTGIPPLGDN